MGRIWSLPNGLGAPLMADRIVTLMCRSEAGHIRCCGTAEVVFGRGSRWRPRVPSGSASGYRPDYKGDHGSPKKDEEQPTIPFETAYARAEAKISFSVKGSQTTTNTIRRANVVSAGCPPCVAGYLASSVWSQSRCSGKGRRDGPLLQQCLPYLERIALWREAHRHRACG